MKFHGVRKRKWGKWVSEIRSHDTPEKAAKAYDAALFCLRGQGAKFNFPGNLPNVHGATNLLNPTQIQKIAAKYANEEPQQQHMVEEEGHQHKVEEEENMTTNRCTTSNVDWDFLDQLLSVPGGMGNALSTVANVSEFGVNGCAV
ncbi:hypothetical protein MKW94_022819 [Papaver nudicaule]|uniref:AP2/ERF domain-containing protein n=1 Tax=Papaver nudicaule TaxID=74823 RepID=A0AA41RZ66_PAPNU|nr:hypothetical protein [Papaver nudicaule]MCL7051298.1 hypothetical protein [Papaver nudicaule]